MAKHYLYDERGCQAGTVDVAVGDPAPAMSTPEKPSSKSKIRVGTAWVAAPAGYCDRSDTPEVPEEPGLGRDAVGEPAQDAPASE